MDDMNLRPDNPPKRMRAYYAFKNWQNRRKQLSALEKWEKSGKSLPPPHLVKQHAIKTYAEEYNLEILVETGTYYGDMIEAMKKVFRKIYSIELSESLYNRARDRFRNDHHVVLIHGDSGTQLKNLAGQLDKPALFWLDGHYSAGVTARGDEDTPVMKELDHILGSRTRGHVILIDDARCFGTDHGYPSIDEIESFVRARQPDVDISIQDDCIRITPASRSTV
jgi:hypothetical protein